MKETNTAMLAGRGPDLLEMDQLPQNSYVQKGLLADQGALMDQDKGFKKEDYFSNILDHVRINGKLYGMPLSFFLEGLTADKSEIAKTGVKVDDQSWTWNDFTRIAGQLKQNGKFSSAYASYPVALLSEMVNDQYSQFVDTEKGKASFDSAAFTDMMKQVKDMADQGVIGPSAYFYPIQINSPYDYIVSLREQGENAALYAFPHGKDVAPGGFFRSYQTIGLNANSSVKAGSMGFH